MQIWTSCGRGLALAVCLALLLSCRQPPPDQVTPTSPEPADAGSEAAVAAATATPRTTATLPPASPLPPASTTPSPADAGGAPVVAAPTATPSPSPGADFSVDQASTAYAGGLWSLAYLAPIGQLFTPAAANLDQVLLWTAAGGVNEAATLQVHIRAAGADGPLLGPIVASSEPVTLPPDFTGATPFPFAAPVTLTPGQTYALEPVLISGANRVVGWSQHAGWNDPYPAGTAVVAGQPLALADLWFQTGRRP